MRHKSIYYMEPDMVFIQVVELSTSLCEFRLFTVLTISMIFYFRRRVDWLVEAHVSIKRAVSICRTKDEDTP